MLASLHLSSQRLRCFVLAALVLGAVPAHAIDRPGDDRFQSWLQREAQERPQNFTGQFEYSDTNRQLARTILDRLWDNQEYRDHLHAWLDTHQAATAEDLVERWIVDYHDAFAKGLEFADKSKSLMWRLQGLNATGALDRAQCAGVTRPQLDALFEAAHAKLVDDHASEIARMLPDVMGREYARQNHPRPGDRQVAEVMVMISRNSLHAVAGSLPPEDSRRLIGHYSYTPPEESRKVTPQEFCEQNWVVSHAIDDGRLSDTAHHVSSLLLQQQVTISAYQQMFEQWDAAGGAQPASADFKPGKARIATPALLTRRRAVGSTRVRIRVDEAGHYQGASLIDSTVQPEQVESLDGSTFKAADLLLAVVDAYYRDGSFQPHQVDGVARPQDFVVAFNWR